MNLNNGFWMYVIPVTGGGCGCISFIASVLGGLMATAVTFAMFGYFIKDVILPSFGKWPVESLGCFCLFPTLIVWFFLWLLSPSERSN